MLFERHKSSRGRIFGGQVEICPDSYLCPNSHAEGNADIWRSIITDSRIRSGAKVRNSRIEGLSTIEQCEISNSHLINTKFLGGTALNCYINNSLIEGAPYFRGGKVIDCKISDSVRLENDATVIGLTLKGFMRIGYGVWTRPPRYLEINTDETEVGITESVKGFAYISCRHNSIVKWLKKRKLFQKTVGWSDETIKQISLTLEEWQDV